MRKQTKKFILNYLSTFSPTGFEKAGQKVWTDYLRPAADEFFADTYGTAVAVHNPGKKFRVVIEAHADEIAWFVNYVSPDGLIYLIRNGGSDPQIAPSKRVVLHTESGPLNGVFGWPAIHVRPRTNTNAPEVKDIYVDCGFTSKEEADKAGVLTGTVVTFDDPPFFLNDKLLTGRALDNRLGGLIIAEVMHKIKRKKIKLPFTLYAVNSVQEEIGLRGAAMIAERIKPHLAICTDVCHHTGSPTYSKIVDGETLCGKGPVLTVGASVHHNVFRMLRDTAKKSKIPYQLAAAGRGTGTDTDAFAYSGAGVPSALISMPLKYMHTTVETAHLDDIKNASKLMFDFLVNLKAGHDFSYFKP